MNKKSVLDTINELYTIIKPEGFDFDKQTYKLSQKKKKIFKGYIKQCRELLSKDIEEKIKQLKGEELLNYIKKQNKRSAWGTIASIEYDYKKLCKNEQTCNWFSLEFLINLRYFEMTYNIKIINKEDFKK